MVHGSGKSLQRLTRVKTLCGSPFRGLQLTSLADGAVVCPLGLDADALGALVDHLALLESQLHDVLLGGVAPGDGARVSQHRLEVRRDGKERQELEHDAISDAVVETGRRQQHDERDDVLRVENESPRDEDADYSAHVLDEPRLGAVRRAFDAECAEDGGDVNVRDVVLVTAVVAVTMVTGAGGADDGAGPVAAVVLVHTRHGGVCGSRDRGGDSRTRARLGTCPPGGGSRRASELGLRGFPDSLERKICDKSHVTGNSENTSGRWRCSKGVGAFKHSSV